jgi:hypothetical protein
MKYSKQAFRFSFSRGDIAFKILRLKQLSLGDNEIANEPVECGIVFLPLQV